MVYDLNQKIMRTLLYLDNMVESPIQDIDFKGMNSLSRTLVDYIKTNEKEISKFVLKDKKLLMVNEYFIQTHYVDLRNSINIFRVSEFAGIFQEESIEKDDTLKYKTYTINVLENKNVSYLVNEIVEHSTHTDIRVLLDI